MQYIEVNDLAIQMLEEVAELRKLQERDLDI